MCVCVFILFSSPAEELSFGSVETERKSLIILSNVAKNQVAFKVSVFNYIIDDFHTMSCCIRRRKREAESVLVL